MKAQLLATSFTAEDRVAVARYVFSGLVLLTIGQKLYNPILAENFSDFLALLTEAIFGTAFIPPDAVFVAVIVLEVLLTAGLFLAATFGPAVSMWIAFATIGSTASVFSLLYALDSSCGCGFFGDNPYLVLGQKLVLIGLLLYMKQRRHLLFPT